MVYFPVVKVRGYGGLSPLLPFEPPCNSMSPLIESIKCYFTPKNAKLVGLEWVWGLLQPGFVPLLHKTILTTVYNAL